MSGAGDAIRRPRTPYYGILYTAVGIPSGFVSVTLAYELRQRGISVAAIAGIVSLSVLPWTWKVLGGPMLDLSLTPRIWSTLCIAAVAATLALLGLTAATSAQALGLLSGLSLMTGVATVLFAASINNIVGAVEPETERGAIGGYVQAGNLGGSGLGGGAGLWLAQHAGGLGPASEVLAAICLVCALPLLAIRAPKPARPETLRVKTVQLWRQVWAMIRSRAGALALLLNLLPMALGASNNLWAAVAGDWRASGDVVALVTGALGGVASIPGSLIAGALCRRYPPRGVYYWSGALCAGALIAMAATPHTQTAFIVFTLASAALLGAAWGSLSSVAFNCIGCEGAATKAALIGSACNIPVVAGIAAVGAIQTRFGSNAMLLGEAGLAIVSMAVYAMVIFCIKPEAAAVEATA